MNENTKIEKDNKKSCFIITPIGDPKSEIFRKITGVIDSVIKPVLNQYGFSDVKAAHEICESGSINNQVIDKIINSDLVVANLTDTNPNVMYELCLRHVVAKPIIHICENGTPLPFDIRGDRTIFYADDMLGVEELKKEIEKYLNEIDYSQEYRDNPVYNGRKLSYLLKEEINDKSNIEIELLQTILNTVAKNNQYSQAIASIPMTAPTEKEAFFDMVMEERGVFFIIKTDQWSFPLFAYVTKTMSKHGFGRRKSYNPQKVIFFNGDDVDLEKVFQDLEDITEMGLPSISVQVIQTKPKIISRFDE